MNCNLIQLILGTAFLILGLIVFVLQIIGVFKFKYVMNRMHAAGMGDTLGIGFCMAGLMIISGPNFTTLKMLCVVIFLWFTSPVSSHLIAQLEVLTGDEHEKDEKHYEMTSLSRIESELQATETSEKAADGKEA